MIEPDEDDPPQATDPVLPEAILGKRYGDVFVDTLASCAFLSILCAGIAIMVASTFLVLASLRHL